MKSLLIIDTPKTCKECPCQLMFVCVPADEDIDEYIDPNETKPDWCPLRPLPLKEKIKNKDEFMETYGWMQEVTTGMDVGWNDCIDEITGETE